MERIAVAVIGKAQGIKGEVKINLISGNAERFKKYKRVYIKNDEYEIEYVKDLPNGVFAKFKDVNDRNTAELLVNKEISVERKEIRIDNDEYFVNDLINCEVIAGGKILGVLKEVLQNGAADVYVVKGEKSFMFPALKKVLINIDVASKRIDLDAEILDEIILYED